LFLLLCMVAQPFGSAVPRLLHGSQNGGEQQAHGACHVEGRSGKLARGHASTQCQGRVLLSSDQLKQRERTDDVGKVFHPMLCHLIHLREELKDVWVGHDDHYDVFLIIEQAAIDGESPDDC